MRVVLLDRDGVLNESPTGGPYVTRPEDLHLRADVLESLAALRDRGFAFVVVTNQQGVAKGELTEETLGSIHRRLVELLASGGISLADILACTHLDSAGCPCRKPRPGMLLEAARRHGFALGETFFVGDSLTDVVAGRAAGARTILLVEEGRPAGPYDPAPDAVVRSLSEAAAIVAASP